MKNTILSLAVLSLSFGALAAKKKVALPPPRVIEFNVEKKDGKTIWSPERAEVHPGERIEFKVNHNLEGGFDFHGFSVKALDIVGKVDRNTPYVITKTVPADLKVGEYPVTCQFHPAHVAATLVVLKDEVETTGTKDLTSEKEGKN